MLAYSTNKNVVTSYTKRQQETRKLNNLKSFLEKKASDIFDREYQKFAERIPEEEWNSCSRPHCEKMASQGVVFHLDLKGANLHGLDTEKIDEVFEDVLNIYRA